MGRREGVYDPFRKYQTAYPQRCTHCYPQRMFKRKKENIEASLLAGQIRDRVSTLENDIRKLQTAHKHLELEWTELYDKVRHAMSRISKRAERAERANEETIQLSDAGNGEDTSGFTDPISARILARRAHGR